VKVRPLAIPAFVLICVLAAAGLSLLSSPQQGAKAAIEKITDNRGLEVSFDAQRNRGVICGRYGSRTVGWTPFIYVSHYSSESPNEPLLFIGASDASKDRKAHYGC
jgi:hypothetical protein